jgi:menaquinol-cytochrome c reductase iron-sulfur subunit
MADSRATSESVPSHSDSSPPVAPGSPTDPAPPEVDVSRRRFVMRALAGIGALIAALVGIPVVGFAAMPFFRARTAPQLLPEMVPPTIRSDVWSAAGELDEYAIAEPQLVPLQRQISDGWVAGMAPAVVYLVRLTESEVVAYDIHCTHLGCPLSYSSGSGSFVCPCHGGSFDINGEVTGGPPPGPMNQYLVRVVDGIVEVGPLEKEA